MEIGSVGGMSGTDIARQQRPVELTDAERKQVEELKRTDREVRAHEMAHKAAAGRHATSGPQYEYERGPDGRRYAVGGHVNVDTSTVPGDPEATLQKMQQIQHAALAPADPSPQDRRVAAEAARQANNARMDTARERGDEPGGRINLRV